MESFWLILAIKGVMIGSIYALISLGFNVIYRTTGVLNFAQGEFLMVGSLAAASLHGKGGVGMGTALLLGVGAAGLTGVLVDRLAIRPVRHSPPVVLVIVTIGVSLVLRAAASLIWGTDPYHLPPMSGGHITAGGVQIEAQSFWILGVAVACMAGLALFFQRTALGRAMRACAENPEAAGLCGIDRGAMSLLAFGLSAVLAGISGILLTPLLSMSYDRGTMLGLKGFASAVLGGLGHPVAGVAGGLVLGMLEQLGAWYSSAHKEILALSVVVVLLLCRPQGIFAR